MKRKMKKLGNMAASVVFALAAMPTTTGTAAKVAINANAVLRQLVSVPVLRRVPRRIAAPGHHSFHAGL